ncbi:MAG: FkbM family methyltransferase [Chitinophagaceae bacterium]
MAQRSGFLSNVLHGLRFRARQLTSGNAKKAGLNRYTVWKLKHLPYNSPHAIDLKGKTIHFNNGPELWHSIKEIFIEEVYKLPITNPTPYMLDCGSNIGLAIIYLKTHFPGAHIVGFEPDKTNFSFLQKNIDANNLTNVELRNEAIWKEDTTLQFAGEGTHSSRIEEQGNSAGTVEVKATRLKNLLDRKVDFLKMDIEGAEYEVLKDCGDRLQMIDNLFIEFHGHFNKTHELTEILQLVEANNFAYYIREAAMVYPTPFHREGQPPYDLQLNIFCFKIS